MTKEMMSSKQDQIPSFEEFKETILQRGADADLLSWVASEYSRIPRLIRTLHNIDPTGIFSAIDQLFNDETSEREQENILQAIYALAIQVWNVETEDLSRLPDDKFAFLYFIYAKSETDIYARVRAEDVQSFLEASQRKTISIGQYLDRNGLVEFNTWVEGIRITHDGIVRIETELLGSSNLPEYVDESVVGAVEERVQLRSALLRKLYEVTEGDTFKKVSHADLAESSGLDHYCAISQILPYLNSEGWIRFRTADTLAITEEGVDRVEAFFN